MTSVETLCQKKEEKLHILNTNLKKLCTQSTTISEANPTITSNKVNNYHLENNTNFSIYVALAMNITFTYLYSSTKINRLFTQNSQNGHLCYKITILSLKNYNTIGSHKIPITLSELVTVLLFEILSQGSKSTNPQCYTLFELHTTNYVIV